MARIPTEELERLKEEISVERLVEGAGIELKAHGADKIGRCPFHDDKTPSLVVSPQKNLWHCLGACQTGGTVIDWVMKTQGVSFRHAVEILQDNEPLAAVPGRAAPGRSLRSKATPGRAAVRSTTQKVASDFTSEADDQALMRQVIDYYHETLKESPEALDYLAQRGLKAAGLIETFRLGFANRTLGYRLPAKNRKAGAELRGQLQKLGLLRESGHEHFNGSLVIPVMGEHGVVTEVYGRKITPNLRKGTPLHLYLPGPHRGVFNIEALRASKEIILCESLIDALTFWSAGFRNVTASYGTAGFTDELLEAFKANGIERVLIAYDRDEAGNAAAAKLAERLKGEGLDSFRILFPKGMDANEYALKVQPAAKSLGLVIRKAEWVAGATANPGMGPTTAIDAESVEADDELVVDELPLVADIESEVPSPSLVASPVPSAPASPADAIEAEQRERETVIVLGDRRYRVRGLQKNLSFDQLKVNLLVTRTDASESSRSDQGAFYVDTFDLYSARHRGVYLKQAALELGLEERVIRHDLGQVLLKLEALQEAQIAAALKPEKAPVVLDDTERAAALELLRDPNLLDRILADFERAGLVGEETNKLVGYLACVSRKLERPLAVIIQSTSAAGKSALMEAVLKLMPDEDTVHYSAMTGQSLFYMGETDLKHKILGVAEEAGVEEAAYALKLLQSQGELTIASTGKDPASGKLVTQEYRVEGPVMLFLTTTAVEIDEELLNRCLVLSVNETREQTKAIHAAQRAQHTLAGLLAERESRDIVKLHRNAQRLIRPLLVANPYAEQLTFRDEQTRLRRDHLKYLTLIRAIALLHQYQRVLRTADHQGQRIEYIEVTLEDIKIANRLAHEVLGRTLDELPPQTRHLLGQVHAMVAERAKQQGLDRSDVRFTRREVREATGWGNTQLKVHLHRLEDMEYLLAHRGGRGQSFVYELLYDGEGEDGRAFVMGLIDPDRLAPGQSAPGQSAPGQSAPAHPYDGNRSGSAAKRSGSSRPQVGAKSDRPNRETGDASSACEESGENAEKHVVGPTVAQRSYRSQASALVAAPRR